MTTLITLIAGYLGLLVVLYFVAQPYRFELNRLANEMVADNPGDDVLRHTCEAYLRTAYAWRAAPIRFVMFLLALLIPGPTLDRECDAAQAEHPEIFNDDRLHRLIDCYAVSILAVNPIFGVLMFLARWAFKIKARIYFHGKNSEKLSDYVGMKAYS